MEHNRNLTYIMKRGVKRLNCSFFFLLFSFFLQAQPGDAPHDNFHSTNGTDTLFNKREIIVRNAAMDTLEITGYKNGEKHGQQKLFYSNGDLKLIANYKKGLLNGKVEYFARTNQQILKIEHYKPNLKEETSVLHGKVITYFHNGGISKFFTYKDGEKNGKYELYHANKQLEEKGEYENNLNIDRKLTYNSEGTLLKDENYIIIDNPRYPKSISKQGNKDDKSSHKRIARIPEKISVLDGNIKYYYRNGLISSDFKFIKGKKEGLCKEFYADKKNTLKSAVVFKDGKQHGSFVYYKPDGNIESQGIFYHTIKVGDTVYNNVYDGEIIYYQDHGKKNRLEDWKDFKKNGISEWFTYQSGEISQRSYFKDNLKTGTENRFDKEGHTIYEAHYEIVKIDGKKASQKTGIETSWKNGQLFSTTEWKNGVKEGTTKTYYNNGQVEKKMHFEKGELTGPYQTFYENGQIEKDFLYHLIYKSKSRRFIGWNKMYDKSGNLLRKFYAKGDGKNSIDYHFENGKQKELLIDDVFRIDFTSDQKIEVLQWLWRSTPILGYDLFRNQQLRRIHFNANNYNGLLANFTNDGQLIQVKTTTSQFVEDKAIDEIAEEIAAQYDPNWNNEEMVNQGITNGTYQWEYANGSPFFQIKFKNSLPQGSWIIYDPISKDTLLYAEFNKGRPVGKWIRKRVGGDILSRKSFFPNHQIKESYSYGYNGILQDVYKYDSTGNSIYYAEHHPNGLLKYEVNRLDNTNLRMNEKGDTSNYNLLSTDGDSIRIERSFYEGNAIKGDRRNNLSTGFGELKTYHKNGQLKTLNEMKDKEKEGIFRVFDKEGNLLISGQFKDGKQVGKWVRKNTDGSTKISYYEDGELIINPTEEDEKACRCYDKSLANSKIGFSPLLSYLADYKSIQPYIPKMIIPIDDWNYEHIFYVNMQTDNNKLSGFTSLKLLMFGEFSFEYPVADYLKFNLNPCRVGGYLSNIDATFSYNFTEEKVQAQLSTQRIAISLEKNPLVNAEDKTPFTAYFDTDGMDISEKGIGHIAFINKENNCYPLGLINNFMEVEIKKAKLNIDPWKGNFSNLPLIANEITRFYGFEISDAAIKFDYPTGNDNLEIRATSKNIVAGANYVAGRISIQGKSKGKDTFTLKDSEKSINLDQFQRYFEKKGFYRVKVEIIEDTLWVEFYTEK